MARVIGYPRPDLECSRSELAIGIYEEDNTVLQEYVQVHFCSYAKHVYVSPCIASNRLLVSQW